MVGPCGMECHLDRLPEQCVRHWEKTQELMERISRIEAHLQASRETDGRILQSLSRLNERHEATEKAFYELAGKGKVWFSLMATVVVATVASIISGLI